LQDYLSFPRLGWKFERNSIALKDLTLFDPSTELASCIRPGLAKRILIQNEVNLLANYLLGYISSILSNKISFVSCSGVPPKSLMNAFLFVSDSILSLVLQWGRTCVYKII
jgi:hypothetical protein